jgi:hypothetical protein
LICSACGFNNEDNAKYCQRCGNSLNYYSRGANTYSKSNNYQQSRNNSNTIIIAVTLIIIALIVAGTFLLISDNIPFSNNNSQNNQTNQVTYNQLKVNTATFYLDGNPNTGIKTTINVGREHAGETMGVMTTFSRDGVNMNNPSEYGQCVVDDEGDIVFTDYTPIPKYPDYCLIEITYNNHIFKWECDMGKYKGYQTSVPRVIS